MKVAIIGGGFAGLGATYELVRSGHTVTIYEKAPQLGGLAVGTTISGEPIESFYHHLFPTYLDLFDVLNELGAADSVHFRKAKVATVSGGVTYPFTGALDLLRFTPLTFWERIRAGVIIFYLQHKKKWKDFENKTAAEWLRKYFGKHTYETLWHPLLVSKFGDQYEEVSMVWFWSRVYERPTKFGYFVDGCQGFTDRLVEHLKDLGTQILTKTEVQKIQRLDSGKMRIESSRGTHVYDAVIIAAPPAAFCSIAKDIADQGIIEQAKTLRYIGNVCMIISFREKLSSYYWTNINDDNPFVVIVEQTNLVPDDTYHGQHPVYLSRYVDIHDQLYTLPDEELYALFMKHLKTLYPQVSDDLVTEYRVFRAPFTQQVVPASYESIRPKYSVGESLWWVSMSHTYPWDRGINHSFRAGKELVNEMLAKKEPAILEGHKQDVVRDDTRIAAVLGMVAGTFGIVPVFYTGIALPIVASAMPLALAVISAVGMFCAQLVQGRFSFAPQLMRFLIVGGLSTMIELGILNVLFMTTGVTSGILFSLFKAATFCIAFSNSYFLNKLWTFEGGQQLISREITLFAVVNAVALVLNVGIASFIVNGIGPIGSINSALWANIGAAVAVIVVMLWNFLAYKFVVFRSTGV